MLTIADIDGKNLKTLSNECVALYGILTHWDGVTVQLLFPPQSTIISRVETSHLPQKRMGISQKMIIVIRKLVISEFNWFWIFFFRLDTKGWIWCERFSLKILHQNVSPPWGQESLGYSESWELFAASGYFIFSTRNREHLFSRLVETKG